MRGGGPVGSDTATAGLAAPRPRNAEEGNPVMTRTTRCRAVLSGTALAIAAAALVAAPASAAAGSACPNTSTVQPFAQWHDVADYMLAPDGGIEAGAGSWLLDGGAEAVEGNEPFQVGGASDHMSLSLPAGSSATTEPTCIGVEHKTMRFFSRGATSGALRVQAIYTKHSGRQKIVPLGTVRGSGAWAPTAVVPMRVNESAASFNNAMSVSLRFTPRGSRAWQIDDVYIDPYRTH
jgi:hypothetical protein